MLLVSAGADSSDMTVGSLQWVTPLTKLYTLNIQNGRTLTVNGTVNLNGSDTYPVSFEGTGTFSPATTVYYCSSSTVTGINCQPGAPPAAGYDSTPKSQEVPGESGVIYISGLHTTTPYYPLFINETGTQTLNVAMAITGTDAAKFSTEISGVSATSFSILDGGAQEQVDVVCDGSVLGSFTATLTVTHNATGSPATYPLACDIVLGGGGGSTPTSASVESDLGLALVFLGIVGMVAWKRKKLFG